MLRDMKLSHITMCARDLQVAEAFYVDLLGARLVRRMDRETLLRTRPDRAHEADDANSPLHLSVAFGDDHCELQLFLQRWPAQPSEQGHPHVAIEVPPHELLERKARLEARGVPVDGPRRLGPPGHASLYFFDPFGNHLEFATMGFEGPVSVGPPAHERLTYAW